MVPNKSDYIHSLGMLTSGFQDPPVWQLVDDDRQTITRLQTTQRNVHNQEMSYTVFPQCTSVHLRVCLWTTYKTLLLLLDICYSVHVTAPAKTLIVLKGHDRVCNVCLHMYSIWRDVLNLRSGFFFPGLLRFLSKTCWRYISCRKVSLLLNIMEAHCSCLVAHKVLKHYIWKIQLQYFYKKCYLDKKKKQPTNLDVGSFMEEPNYISHICHYAEGSIRLLLTND